MAGGEIAVTVVWATASEVHEVAVRVPAGSTLRDAVAASGLLAQMPLPTALDLGVFNRPCATDSPARAGDRIEIYRPLTVDPKEARRVRAEVRRRRAAA